MKNIKKIMAITFALFAVVFLFACSNNTEKENSFHKAFVGKKIAAEYSYNGQSGLLILEFSSKEDVKITEHNVDGMSTEVGKYNPTQDKVTITIGEKTTEYIYELFADGVSLNDGQNGKGYHYFDYNTQINQTYYGINGDEFSIIDFTTDGVITETTYIKNSDDLPTVQTTNYFTHNDLMVLYSASDNQVSNEVANFTIREESMEVGIRPHIHTAKSEIEGDFYYYIVNEEQQMIEGLTFDKEGKMTITSTFVLKDLDDEFKTEVVENEVEKNYFQVAQYLVTYEIIQEEETEKIVFDWNTVSYGHDANYLYSVILGDETYNEVSQTVQGKFTMDPPIPDIDTVFEFYSSGVFVVKAVVHYDGEEFPQKPYYTDYYIFGNVLISVFEEGGKITIDNFEILEDGNIKFGNKTLRVVED